MTQYKINAQDSVTSSHYVNIRQAVTSDVICRRYRNVTTKR